MQINNKSILYMNFMAATTSLSLWAFSFMMCQNANMIEEAFLWRRISGIGVSFFYAFVLHFIIRLIYKKSSRGINFICGMTFIPSIILIYVYTISDKLSQVQIHMIETHYGWTTLPIKNIWEYFFEGYYFVYIFFAIVLLIIRYIKSQDQKDKVVARNIALSFMATFVIGTLTDVIVSSTNVGSVPQIGPILSLLPIAIIFMSMINYGFLRKVKEPIAVTILDEPTRMKVGKNILIITMALCIIKFIGIYFKLIK